MLAESELRLFTLIASNLQLFHNFLSKELLSESSTAQIFRIFLFVSLGMYFGSALYRNLLFAGFTDKKKDRKVSILGPETLKTRHDKS